MNFLKRNRSPFLVSLLPVVTGGLLLLQMGVSSVRGQEGAIVKSIKVEYVGNQTVAPERILSNMSTRVGQKLSMTQVDEDVKSLYASGDVENVRILSEAVSGGVALTVVAQTRAVYGGVQFVGNTLIETSKLSKKVDLDVNKPIDETALQTARGEIQDMYRKKGFSAATVTYRIGAPTAEGYSSVIFTIDEGNQGVLRNVEFVGNTAFTAAALKAEMTQKEKGLKSIFGSGGSTDAETLENI